MKYDPSLHTFRKPARSNGSGGNNCVEIADLPDGGALVRDSKDPTGPVLHFTGHEWPIFIAAVKGNEFG